MLNLADVDTYYARETVKVVKITRALLMTARGRAAAAVCVGHLAKETPIEFVARVISTANPSALFDALVVNGISETETRAAYHCCWVSTALRFAKRCREVPGCHIDRVGRLGNTILAIAINGEAELAVYWLLRAGASPRAPNINGTTPLSCGILRCIKNCVFAIDECVHERMKILMLCDSGTPPSEDMFADAVLQEMTRAVAAPKKRQRPSKK